MHGLLERQLRRRLGEGAEIPEAWRALLADVDAAYRAADEERELMERELEITSRELIERNERLRESHKRFQAVVENALDVTIILDQDARVLYVSPAIRDLLGYTAAEVAGENMVAYVPAADRRALLAAFARGRRRPGEVITVDARCRHRDGSLRHLAFRGRGLFDHPGIGGVLVNIRDVTERREAEQGLRESEARFRGTFENAAVGMAQVDRRGRLTHANDALCETLGYTREELLERTFGEISHPDDVAASQDRFRRAMREGMTGTTVEKRYLHKSGRVVWGRLTASLVRDEAGRPEYNIAVIEDVTERKRAEEALQKAHDELERRVERRTSALERANADLEREVTERRRAEAEVRAVHAFHEELLNNLPAGVAVLDREGRYRFLNPGAIADPDLRAWLIGKTEVDYGRYRGLDVRIGEARRAHVLQAVREERTVQYEETFTTSKGKRHFIRWLSPIRGADGEVTSVVGYGTDVTEIKEAEAQLRQRLQLEQALRASETRYRALVDNVQDVVFQTDVQGRWTLLSPAWTDVTGFDVEESLGQPSLHFVHPEDQPASVSPFNAIIRGEQASARQAFRCRMKGGGYRHVEVHAGPVVGADGAIVGTAGTLHDVTDSVRFEAEQEARRRAEEMLRLKSSLLNNMSHELRTPLTGILGFADVLAEEVGDELRDFAEIIQRSARRLLETLNSVLDLAQLEGGGVELRPEPLDLGAETGEALLLLRPLAEQKGLALRFDAPAPTPHARVDRACFHRILNNLVGNAIKFTDEGGVDVRLRADAGDVLVEVRDTGAGIDAAFLPHLFEEFRQESTGLDRSHEGSGLGLAITKRLVDLSGGAIGVESRKEEGSRFTLRFPRLDPGGDASASAPGATPGAAAARAR